MMLKLKGLMWVLGAVLCFTSYGQTNNHQTIRGVVVDKLSQHVIEGASVLLEAMGKNTITNAKGVFTLADVAPERYEVKVSFVGYQSLTIPNVVVTAGKEVWLDIGLEENISQLNEVVVHSSGKAGTINKLATVSARTFSMEEVNRYAGGRNDPARLAANFAGVSAPDDSRNDIVIRGNSPTGVLWRIDGMNVTNPNHFASVGTTGGAVSALNTNLLKNSDFFTSAFPAEYGNATSGVFDLGLRNGNTQKRETTLQFGVITGLEATTEGPFSKKKEASYLVGYRYSLAGIAQSAGLNIGTTARPAYQDLSFKINSGTTRWGKFSMFGILANSTISIDGGSSSTLYGNGNQTDFYSAIGIVGLNHFKQLNSRSFISSSIGLNYSKTDMTNYDSDRPTNTSYSKETNQYTKTGYNFSTSYNTKINSRLFVKLGLQDEIIGLKLDYQTKMNIGSNWQQIWNNDTSTHLAQAYAEMKYKITNRFKFNGGIHAQQLFLNNSFALEPRVGLKYELNNRNSISFGMGLHSQMQPINMYFNGSGASSNINLGFTKSQHYVLGYDLLPAKDWRIKAEVYYQYLYNVPITNYSSSYSMLNTGSSFKADTTSSLVNTGTGNNYGVELTLEKFFSKGYYALFTASLYSAKYKGSDDVERNTAFNGKYVYNVLAGKEWKVGKLKQNKLSLDYKFTNAGGRAYTPIDLAASKSSGNEVLVADAYSGNYTNYYRMDIKFGYTLNSSRKKISQSLSLDLQNVTNHQNVFSYSYNQQRNALNTTYQLGIFPNLVYKFQF